MEIQHFEIELVELPDGSGRADTYLVDETGRWFQKSAELTAVGLAALKAVAADDEDELPFSDPREVTG